MTTDPIGTSTINASDIVEIQQLLARYGHMNLIGGLAADVGRPGGPRGLWVLAPGNDQHSLPTLNGAPIPITNAAQHTRLTSAWLRNEHRAAAIQV